MIALSKAVKLKNDNYLDSNYIVHNKSRLSKILDILLNRGKITSGVEFETGRIVDGKKEYGKIIHTGTVPSATTKAYAIGITGFDRYTFMDGYTSNAWVVKMVPQKIDDLSIVLTGNGPNIEITTYTSHWSDANYQCYVELHYLKNE